MKTNVPVTLTDKQRDQLANLIDGKMSARLISRREVCAIVDKCIDAALTMAVDDPEPGQVVGVVIISDINAGGWSLIGE